MLLDALSIPSFAVEPGNISEVYDTIAILGELCGCVDGASQVIAEMRKKISGVEERVQGREIPLVFWLLGEDPLMTAGPETFVSKIITLGGGKNIFDDVQERWPLVSPEQILLRKPEWILFGDDMGEVTLSGKAFWQLIPAVTEGRVVSVNGDILYRYGPRLADAVELVAKILHEK